MRLIIFNNIHKQYSQTIFTKKYLIIVYKNSMPLPSSIQGITLKVTSVTQDIPPIQAIHEQIISSAVTGENIGIPITASDILNAFNTKPAGTIFTPSIVVNYVNNITSVSVPASTPNVSNFVPKKITSILSLASTLNKLTTDSSFSLSDFITTNRLGDLSYSHLKELREQRL
jgi:hypothetical protein